MRQGGRVERVGSLEVALQLRGDLLLSRRGTIGKLPAQ
jgi:hypothetical protein